MDQITTKAEAAKLFGTYSALARALGLTKQAVNQWPDELTIRQQNEVVGAAIRLGKIPCQLTESQ